MGVLLSFSDAVDDDLVIPRPPDQVEVETYLGVTYEPEFSVSLVNADEDTGVFMAMSELPSLLFYLRRVVLPVVETLLKP